MFNFLYSNINKFDGPFIYYSVLTKKLSSLGGIWWFNEVPTLAEPNWNNFSYGQIVTSGERYYPENKICKPSVSPDFNIPSIYNIAPGDGIPGNAKSVIPAIAMYWECKKQKEWCYRCIDAGLSGTSEPVWVETAGAEITDNAATWEAVLFDSLKTSYLSVSMSLNYIDRSRNSEVLVNCEYQQDGDFNYDTTTRVLTFNKYVDERLPVIVRTPMPAKWIIDDILEKVVDKLPSTLPKEYFQSNLIFTDWLIYNEINCQKSEPIRAIEQIVEAIPGEWLIETVGEDDIRISVYNKILNDEYPTTGSFTINEFFFRGEPSISDTNIDRFNTINVMKHATIRTAYVEVATGE